MTNLLQIYSLAYLDQAVRHSYIVTRLCFSPAWELGYSSNLRPTKSPLTLSRDVRLYADNNIFVTAAVNAYHRSTVLPENIVSTRSRIYGNHISTAGFTGALIWSLSLARQIHSALLQPTRTVHYGLDV
jgi:hypothetical protein